MVRQSIGFTLLAAIALLLPGCGGCKSDKVLDREAAAKAKTKAEAERRQREKEPFTIAELRIQPYNLGRDKDAIERSIKPGHWTSGALVATANHENFAGQLATEPLDLPDVPFRLSSVRPLVLAKGQPKTIDSLFFIPPRYSQQLLSTQLRTDRGSEIARAGQGLIVIPAHQFFFVVLARDPDRYLYLKDLDLAKAPTGNFDPPVDLHYRVVLPRVRTRTPLSTNPLAWTNIAYVLWDNQDPSTLTLPQQAALVDWLHWGGQLIIGGPENLSALKGSFLEPFLPATVGGKLELTGEALAPLIAEGPNKTSPLKIEAPWSAETLLPHASSEVALKGTGDAPLVVERRVGNGRVVATAFRLGQRQLVNWDGNDSFLNRYILRRPGRSFVASQGEVAVRWTDNRPQHDSRLVSRLRFFSRDANVPGVGDEPNPRAIDEFEQSAASQSPSPAVAITPQGFDPSTVPLSVAAWNDRSDVSSLAQDAVRDATRIEIPNARFVVRMLALYLLVLVPINWLVFRLIGRVEWAWIAAPFIALLGAAVVIRAAQLDIGFVRAKNELATLELFADHPRGHLTRYTTLYTSLSTNYDLHYADLTAVAQPFPSGVDQLYGQGRADLELHRGQEVALRRVPVSSNSVGIVHSEQMFNLDGAITIAPDGSRPGGWQVTNGTKLTLKGAGVLQPNGAAWIGTLAPGATAPLDFNLAIGGPEWAKHRDEVAETAAQPTVGLTHLGPLVKFAESERLPGEWRLVAWTDQELPGVTIQPTAAQSRQSTLVVAHLKPGEIPLGNRDRSSRAEVEAALEPLRILQGYDMNGLDTFDLTKPDAPSNATAPAAPSQP